MILLRYQILDWTKIAAELSVALDATAEEFAKQSALLIVISEG